MEAYSNFLWVVLLAPFFLLRMFEPYLTLKALSSLLVIASFAIVYRTFRPYFERNAEIQASQDHEMAGSGPRMHFRLGVLRRTRSPSCGQVGWCCR